jgi:hypothetical protein
MAIQTCTHYSGPDLPSVVLPAAGDVPQVKGCVPTDPSSFLNLVREKWTPDEDRYYQKLSPQTRDQILQGAFTEFLLLAFSEVNSQFHISLPPSGDGQDPYVPSPGVPSFQPPTYVSITAFWNTFENRLSVSDKVYMLGLNPAFFAYAKLGLYNAAVRTDLDRRILDWHAQNSLTIEQAQGGIGAMALSNRPAYPDGPCPAGMRYAGRLEGTAGPGLDGPKEFKQRMPLHIGFAVDTSEFAQTGIIVASGGDAQTTLTSSGSVPRGIDLIPGGDAHGGYGWAVSDPVLNGQDFGMYLYCSPGSALIDIFRTCEVHVDVCALSKEPFTPHPPQSPRHAPPPTPQPHPVTFTNRSGQTLYTYYAMYRGTLDCTRLQFDGPIQNGEKKRYVVPKDEGAWFKFQKDTTGQGCPINNNEQETFVVGGSSVEDQVDIN